MPPCHQGAHVAARLPSPASRCTWLLPDRLARLAPHPTGRPPQPIASGRAAEASNESWLSRCSSAERALTNGLEALLQRRRAGRHCVVVERVLVQVLAVGHRLRRPGGARGIHDNRRGGTGHSALLPLLTTGGPAAAGVQHVRASPHHASPLGTHVPHRSAPRKRPSAPTTRSH